MEIILDSEDASVIDLSLTTEMRGSASLESWGMDQTNSPDCDDSGNNTTATSSPEDRQLNGDSVSSFGLSNKSKPVFKTQRSKNKKTAKRLMKAARNSVKSKRCKPRDDDDANSDDVNSGNDEHLDDVETYEEEEEMRCKANSQERCRMQRMNKALDKLRDCIPQQFRLGARRLSKIRTLRLAISYIAALSDILENDSATNKQSAYHRALGMAVLSGTASVPAISVSDSKTSLDGSTDTPSRLTLREIAGRNLSSSLFSPDVANVSFASGSTSNSSGFLGSEMSSDESFCTDQRFSMGSPQMLEYLGHHSTFSPLEGMIPPLSTEDRFQSIDYLHLPVLTDIYASSLTNQTSEVNFPPLTPYPIRYNLGHLPQPKEQHQTRKQ